jgi:dTDP-4-dehydrorhamnose 3,5-epimerase
MKFTRFSIEGLILIEPDVYPDSRGLFFELYNKNVFIKNGITADYMQDNVSVSNKNVIRGLHFQVAPYEQGKLVSVIRGAVLDVVVDIRKDSPTYGKHEAVELSEHNRRLLWIPPGFAHGFAALEDNTTFLYKCSNVYHKASERGIRYDDPELNISWNVLNPIVSDKDLELKNLKEYQLNTED